MTQRNQETLIQILEKYHREVEDLREQRGLNGCYFNGCIDRAKQMQEAFAHAGVSAEIIVATTGSSYLTHESNTRWKFHHVVLSEGLVYDPNYSRRASLPLNEYAKQVFLEKDIYLWKKGDKSKPIWQSV